MASFAERRVHVALRTFFSRNGDGKVAGAPANAAWIAGGQPTRIGCPFFLADATSLADHENSTCNYTDRSDVSFAVRVLPSA